jgi:hypothetical protein
MTKLAPVVTAPHAACVAEAERFIAGPTAVADEYKARREQEATRKAQEILRKRDEVPCAASGRSGVPLFR